MMSINPSAERQLSLKAANVSDIIIIDEAKDIGGGLIGPNKDLNYMLALMIGFFTPMFFYFYKLFVRQYHSWF